MVEIVGYRFHPTPQELIGHYLRKKRLDPDWSVQKIKDANIYEFEPSQLPGLFPADQPDQQDWHFFCERDYKFGNKNRVNRKTRGGNWKVTGKKRDIKDKRKNVIGRKITLVFYKGSGNSKHARTNWVMHEYHINHDSHFKREFVVVRIKKNPDTKQYVSSTVNEGISSHTVASNFGNDDTESALQIETQLCRESQAALPNFIEKNHDIFFDKESQTILSNHIGESQAILPNESQTILPNHNRKSQTKLPNLVEKAGQSHPLNLIEQTGQSYRPDFNSSNLEAYGTDAEGEDIAALLHGFFPDGEWRMDFSSMCQQQSYQAVDENILPVQMGGVV
ncbi:hypothetical protein Ddye_002462 [Dipteronia dyeriana]|uniref:NAC domain-containing protein n=1 Tax=Dipteronia dyeriana TaxID=168575 RepID=A0AAD9XR48_9ROSI|nr:hypothetical protein Ddye_002462 [Dipteronia dyeriana]